MSYSTNTTVAETGQLTAVETQIDETSLISNGLSTEVPITQTFSSVFDSTPGSTLIEESDFAPSSNSTVSQTPQPFKRPRSPSPLKLMVKFRKTGRAWSVDQTVSYGITKQYSLLMFLFKDSSDSSISLPPAVRKLRRPRKKRQL